MSSKVGITYLDYSLETSTFTANGVDFSAANFDAQNTLIDNLVGATQAIVLGTKIADTRTASVDSFTETKPASPYAQRELKWRVKYVDTVDPVGNGSREIPTPNLTFLNAEGTHLDLGSTEGAAFVAAFEAYHRSSLGNTVEVSEVLLVGRNN